MDPINGPATDTALSIFVGPAAGSGLTQVSQRTILNELLQDLTELRRSDIYLVTTPDQRQWVDDILPDSDHFHLRLNESVDRSTLPSEVQSTVRELFESGYENVLAMAADTPGLGIAHVRDAIARLRNSDETAVVGPAGDGGFYLLGLNTYREDVLRDVPFYVGNTYESLLDRLDELYSRIEQLEPLNDVDRPTDWLSIKSRWLVSYQWIFELAYFLVFGNGIPTSFGTRISETPKTFLSRNYRSPPLLPIISH
ncbi:MAG: DUF2064 domain-containing protein [bacterium]